MGSREVPAGIARQDRARRDVVLPLSDGITAALQVYADRGVFRGLDATPAGRGRVEYRFTWMLRRPMRVIFDRSRSVLTFTSVFPGVEPRSSMVAALNDVVRSRTDRAVPAHKRVDGRKVRLSSAVRRGEWSLIVTIRGNNQQYAVQRAVNLINELFLTLHEFWPEYLIEHFGLSAE